MNNVLTFFPSSYRYIEQYWQQVVDTHQYFYGSAKFCGLFSDGKYLTFNPVDRGAMLMENLEVFGVDYRVIEQEAFDPKFAKDSQWYYSADQLSGTGKTQNKWQLCKLVPEQDVKAKSPGGVTYPEAPLPDVSNKVMYPTGGLPRTGSPPEIPFPLWPPGDMPIPKGWPALPYPPGSETFPRGPSVPPPTLAVPEEKCKEPFEWRVVGMKSGWLEPAGISEKKQASGDTSTAIQERFVYGGVEKFDYQSIPKQFPDAAHTPTTQTPPNTDMLVFGCVHKYGEGITEWRHFANGTRVATCADGYSQHATFDEDGERLIECVKGPR